MCIRDQLSYMRVDMRGDTERGNRGDADVRGSMIRDMRWHREYGVASVSRIDKIVGLFCKRAL